MSQSFISWTNVKIATPNNKPSTNLSGSWHTFPCGESLNGLACSFIGRWQMQCVPFTFQSFACHLTIVVLLLWNGLTFPYYYCIIYIPTSVTYVIWLYLEVRTCTVLIYSYLQVFSDWRELPPLKCSLLRADGIILNWSTWQSHQCDGAIWNISSCE